MHARAHRIPAAELEGGPGEGEAPPSEGAPDARAGRGRWVWNEGDWFRETHLVWLDDPRDRNTARQFAKLFYNLVVENKHAEGRKGSMTRAELAAALADLPYLERYLAHVALEREVSGLSEEDESLARFAGRLVAKISPITAAMQNRLKPKRSCLRAGRRRGER